MKRDPNPAEAKRQREWKRYVEDRLGDGLFPAPGSFPVPPSFPCHHVPPYPPLAEALFSSETKVAALEQRIDRAFESARRHWGRRIAHVTRRGFLKAFGVTLAGAAAPLGAISCDGSESDRSGEGSESGNDEAVVALVHGDSAEDNVLNAIAMAGGLEEIRPGDSVIIKPNIAIVTVDESGAVPPMCTNPQVIRAVIRAAAERTQDPARVFVADRSAFGAPTQMIMMLCGIWDAALAEGATPLPWESQKYVRWISKRAEYLRAEIRIPQSMRTYDHLINLPALKNHEMRIVTNQGLVVNKTQAEFTLCMKGFVGVCHPEDRILANPGLHGDHFAEKVAELNLCRPDAAMNIIDGTHATIKNGPAWADMEMIPSNLIIASKDRIACDSVGVAVLRYYGALHGVDRDYVRKTVWEQGQIAHGARIGLGIGDPARIEIVDQGLPAPVLEQILAKWSEV